MMNKETRVVIFVLQSLFEQSSVVAQLQSSGEPVDTADGLVQIREFFYNATMPLILFCPMPDNFTH